MRDEKTGKLFMRTASGNWVELPDDLQVYTDPVTGKIFLGQPPPREIVLFLKCFQLENQSLETLQNKCYELSLVTKFDEICFCRTAYGTFLKL